MTTPPDSAAPGPGPVRVVLPADPVLGRPEQEIVARLWRRRQTETGWVFQVGLPSYEGSEDGTVQAAEYRVWVRAPEHVRPVDGVDYDQVPTDRLEAPAPPSAVREILGERRPTGWVVQKVRVGRGPARRVLHAARRHPRARRCAGREVPARRGARGAATAPSAGSTAPAGESAVPVPCPCPSRACAVCPGRPPVPGAVVTPR